MNTYTFDFLTESQDFDHNETFVLESDMIQECSHRQKQIEQLKQQLESCQNELSGISGQLKEAVEVIHWYAMPSINHHAYHDIMGTNLNIKAEQFLAKYRGEK